MALYDNGPVRVRLPAGQEGDVPYAGELDGLSSELRAAVNACKEGIAVHYQSRMWDTWKRHTNEFELVFTSSSEVPGVGTHSPISRSFFKLWEILHDFRSEGVWDVDRGIKAAFLAEGPGGFVESLVTYRRRLSLPPGAVDELHGMTLLSKNRSVPGWKVNGIADMQVHRGSDGTGDVCKLANIDALVAEVGAGTCDVVTADGGFDFSGDFNHQEEASAHLISSEVYAALRLQRPGGSLVLKVYDLHSSNSAKVLFALRSSYSEVHLVKPHTSRPANSEKYVVCTGFIGAADEVLSDLRRACAEGSHLRLRIPREFVRAVARYNVDYISRQVHYISRTIRVICSVREWTRDQRNAAEHALLRRQLDRSVRWCHAYNIKTSPQAIRRYWARLVKSQSSEGGGADPAPRRGSM